MAKLTKGQLSILRNALRFGYSTIEKWMAPSTVDALLTAGAIEKRLVHEPGPERTRLACEMQQEIHCARAKLIDYEWESAHVHLTRAHNLKYQLEKQAWWITDEGRRLARS